MELVAKNLTLVESTRQTGHLGCAVKGIIKEPAKIVDNYTMFHRMKYEITNHDLSTLAMYTVYYADGCYLKICACKKETEDKIILSHQSAKGESFTMTFQKNK